jgi:hypothetical protein
MDQVVLLMSVVYIDHIRIVNDVTVSFRQEYFNGIAAFLAQSHQYSHAIVCFNTPSLYDGVARLPA